MMSSLSPGLILIAGVLLIPLARGVARSALVLGLPLVALAAVWMVPEGSMATLSFLGFELVPVRVTTLGRLFATVFSLAAFAGGLYALRQARTVELAAAFFYAGSAVAATFAGDLITFFVFWELMTLGSTVVIWSAGTRGAYAASMRYLAIHLFGGVLLMLGIALHLVQGGSILMEPMQLESVGSWLILIGFLVNAGAPPLSSWVPDAYPEATPSGMVFLSAYTTKTAVFALLTVFAGAWVLIPVGIYMVFYGIVYALLENDVRRMMAYSIISQVGFMVVGAGIGTQLAINGAAAHAFAHIIYKALLLMAAGSVLLQTGRSRMSELGGLFRTMPTTMLLGTIGALAISSFPFTSGFVSKSMITSSAGSEGMAFAWFALEAASAATFFYVGVRFPWFVFFEKDSGLRPTDPPANMRWAMWIFAFLCIAVGVFPGPLYDILPFPVEYVPYTGEHLVVQFQLLLSAGLAFFVVLPMMRRALTLTLDWDWLYRGLGPVLGRGLVSRVGRAHERVEASVAARMESGFDRLYRHHGPRGFLERTWPTGSMVLWTVVLLAAYLLFGLA